MLSIGAHISSAKGFLAMGKHALALGANTFAFFTRNPRGSAAKPLNEQDIAAYQAFAAEHGFAPAVAHAAYTLNPCSASEKVREFARIAMADDLARMMRLPGNLYNFHPGGAQGQSLDASVQYIADLLDAVVPPEYADPILLETMAHSGGVGSRFEDLHLVIDSVARPEVMGVCLDTCHVWDAGYDIVDDLDGVLTAFDKAVGLDRIHAVHMNDSLNERGSQRDRHAKLGQGKIGREALARVVNHPALREKVFILETPNENEGWAEEIAFLKGSYVE